MSALFDVIMADPPWPYDSPRALVGNGGRGSDGGVVDVVHRLVVGAAGRRATTGIAAIRGRTCHGVIEKRQGRRQGPPSATKATEEPQALARN